MLGVKDRKRGRPPEGVRKANPLEQEESAKQAEAEAARLLYVGMTRARDRFYVTYIGR